MEPFIALASVLGGYLVGSISFARLVTRIYRPEMDIADTNITAAGTGISHRAVNIGANVVSNAVGPGAGMLVGWLDILKVTLITLLFRKFYPGQDYFLLAALAGMAGHNWPVYYRFHGGSGFSPVVGGLLAIDWLAALVTPLAGLFLGLVMFRNLVVASLSWMWLLIPWLWFRTHDPAYVLYALAVNVFFGLAMLPEAKVMLRYKREGKLREYGINSMLSNAMGRSITHLAERFNIHINE